MQLNAQQIWTTRDRLLWLCDRVSGLCQEIVIRCSPEPMESSRKCESRTGVFARSSGAPEGGVAAKSAPIRAGNTRYRE